MPTLQKSSRSTGDTFYPEVECIVHKKNALFDTAIIGVAGADGKTYNLRVPKDELSSQNGKSYLPIGVVEIDEESQQVLIELPQEADSGFRRLWIHVNLLRPAND